MKTVTPITAETFKPYAKLGKSNGKIQGRICDLLLRLVQTDDPAKVKALCEQEIEWLTAEYSKPSTRTSYVSAYRKAIRAYFEEHSIRKGLAVEKQTVKGLVVNHLAESYLMAPAEDYSTVRSANRKKTAAQRDNLTGFNAAEALEATETALKSEDWRELAAGLIMAVQCRPSDMLKKGEFKAATKYRLDAHLFAKARNADGKHGQITCLVDTATFIDAFSRLRREPDVVEMRGWALKDVDSGKNATLNRAVRRVYGDIIPVPFGEDQLSCKNLRAAGVNVAYWLHGRDNQSLGRFAELQLLHDNPGTAANYEDFYCTGDDSKRLMQVGILEDKSLEAQPLSEKRSAIPVDRQMFEIVANAEKWGEGSHADRLERIIARAKQADKAEAQLARECEKRQRLEFEVKRLQAALDVLSEAQPEYRPIEESEFIRADKLKVKPKAIAEAEPADFDWRAVPNAELKGDRRHDAYHEKLRRSVESIQEYNAGLDDSEQFAITGSLLRQLSKVKPGLVKEWMTEHKAEIDSYNAGYGARQNTGKPSPRSVIKWSESAYGIYDW